MTHSPLKARAKLQGQGRTRDTRYPPRKLQEIAGVTDCLIFVYRLQRENDPQHNCSGDAEPPIGGGKESGTPHPHICPDVYLTCRNNRNFSPFLQYSKLAVEKVPCRKSVPFNWIPTITFCRCPLNLPKLYSNGCQAHYSMWLWWGLPGIGSHHCWRLQMLTYPQKLCLDWIRI